MKGIGPERLAKNFREGDEHLFVFVHGLGCSKEAFDGAWNAKELGGHSLLAIDLLGFGDSPQPENFPYTMQSHADVLAQVLREYRHKKIHFVGNSMGPLIGLLMPKEVVASLETFINIEARLLVEDCGNSAKAAQLSYEKFLEHFWPALVEQTAKQRKTAYNLEKALPKAFYEGAKSVVELAASGAMLDLFLNLPIPKVYFYGDDEKSKIRLKTGRAAEKFAERKCGIPREIGSDEVQIQGGGAWPG